MARARLSLPATVVALACATAIAVAPAPAAAAQRLAVLTLTAPWSPDCQGSAWRKSTVLAERCTVLESLADEARSGALAALRGRPVAVMTRENTALLLKENGASVCTEGECEVETAKLIGADWVVSGNVSYVERTWLVTLKLHEVARASLLDTTKVKARTQVQLIEAVQAAAERLVRGGLGLGGGAAEASAKEAAPARPRASPAAPIPPAGGCPEGQEAAGGHCCWPGQDWGTAAGRCLGTPVCPDAFVAKGDACVPGCGDGKVLVGGHCCWPGQDWGARARQCIGTPSCPAGVVFVDGRGCVGRETLGMAALPGGTYPSASAGGTVTIAPFLLDVTEVTAAAYAECVQAGRCSSDGVSWSCGGNYGEPQRANHPMNCVDWHQADAYCRAVGKRLPTDEEWEWAARGGPRGSAFPWGSDAPAAQACWDGEGNDVGKGNRLGTCPVGSFPRGDSPQGVKDLAGNVWEWTAAVRRDERSNRGGGWGTLRAGPLSASDRSWDAASFRASSLGFRCAKPL